MGLDVSATGLQEFSIGYITFNRYREMVAMAFNQEIGALYEKDTHHRLSDKDTDRWNEICSDELDIFLWHSDCDGIFTLEECRKVYKALQAIQADDRLCGSRITFKEWHTLFVNAFGHCAKRRVVLKFS